MQVAGASNTQFPQKHNMNVHSYIHFSNLPNCKTLVKIHV